MALSQIKTNKLRAHWLSASASWSFRNLINLSPSARRRSADQLLLYLGPRGEGRLAEREGVTTCLQLTLARAHEV